MIQRILSALILLPVALGLLIYFPRPFIVVVCALSLIEWSNVCYKINKPNFTRLAWLLMGTCYILWGCASFWYLTQYLTKIELLLLVILICTSDTSAYFVGKFCQGPKLVPSISPNKTWSGAIGAIIGTSLVGTISVLVLPNTIVPSTLTLLIVLCGLLSIIAQIGDLIESWVKRRLDIKDTSHIIPGHGGILDRLDSLLFVAIVGAAVLYFIC